MQGERKLMVKSTLWSKLKVYVFGSTTSSLTILSYLLVLDVVEGRYVCSRLPRWNMPKPF